MRSRRIDHTVIFSVTVSSASCEIECEAEAPQTDQEGRNHDSGGQSFDGMHISVHTGPEKLTRADQSTNNPV